MTGAKVAAWSCIAVGGALSLLANLAYAYLDGKHPSNQDIFIAVIWPVLLYGALELFIRVPWPDTILGWTFRLLASGLVGAVALVTSYGHMHDVLLGANDHPFARVMGPIAIDGLMVSAAAGLVAIKQAERVLNLAAVQPATETTWTTQPAPDADTPGPITESAAASSAPAPSAGATSRRPARAGQVDVSDLLLAGQASWSKLPAAGRTYRAFAAQFKHDGHRAGTERLKELFRQVRDRQTIAA